MSKHTPEPWFVVPLPWDDSGCLVVSQSEDPHIGEIICQTDSGAWNDHTDEDIIRWQHNAHLIAKAPKMLEALKETTDCLADMMSGEGGWAWEEVIEQARILIAKLEDDDVDS